MPAIGRPRYGGCEIGRSRAVGAGQETDLRAIGIKEQAPPAVGGSLGADFQEPSQAARASASAAVPVRREPKTNRPIMRVEVNRTIHFDIVISKPGRVGGVNPDCVT